MTWRPPWETAYYRPYMTAGEARRHYVWFPTVGGCTGSVIATYGLGLTSMWWVGLAAIVMNVIACSLYWRLRLHPRIRRRMMHEAITRWDQ